MPALNYKEIPQANKANGKQDTFELLARDFFEMLGFEIVSGPDRGQDGGRDILAIEPRPGSIGTTEFKWLISCKHKAHSNQSVTCSDENDITDRLRAHDAKGFIGFYSTLASAPLTRKLESLKKEDIEINIFDKERIEKQLLGSKDGKEIVKRYFPKSYTKWETTNWEPSNLLPQYKPLKCRRCGKDLLSHKAIKGYRGIVVFVRKNNSNYTKDKIIDVYWACRGTCDRKLENHYLRSGNNYTTGWEDIADIAIPAWYLRWNMVIMNRIQSGKDIYTNNAFKNLKEFMIGISQLVFRKQTKENSERYKELLSIPFF